MRWRRPCDFALPSAFAGNHWMLSVRVGVSGCSRRPSHVVADLDARVTQIDAAIAEATMRGKTSAALSAMKGQCRNRAGLVEERNREGALSGNPSRRNAPAWPLKAGRSRPKY